MATPGGSQRSILLRSPSADAPLCVRLYVSSIRTSASVGSVERRLCRGNRLWARGLDTWCCTVIETGECEAQSRPAVRWRFIFTSCSPSLAANLTERVNLPQPIALLNHHGVLLFAIALWPLSVIVVCRFDSFWVPALRIGAAIVRSVLFLVVARSALAVFSRRACQHKLRTLPDFQETARDSIP